MRPGSRLIALFGLVISLSAIAQERVVSSLGRLEPENGVVQLAGPSGGGLEIRLDIEGTIGDALETTCEHACNLLTAG